MAQAASPDEKLRRALDDIGRREVSPRMAVFFVCSGDTTWEWLGLDFDVAKSMTRRAVVVVVQFYPKS